MHRDDQQEIAEYLKEFEARTPGFLTYIERPKHTEQIGTWSDFSPDGGQGTAIIVSGPMAYDHHFTRDTIRLYRKHYPEALIILSTWDDEDANYLEDMRDEKTLIQQSKRTDEPRYVPGRNMVYSALQTASEQGVTHVLRTGTHHRLYAPNLINFFKGIQKIFPLADGHLQKKRIITSNYFAFKYVPYCVSASVMFGHIHDMFAYWAAPDGGHPKQLERDWSSPLKVFSEMDPECYYARNYLDRIGVKFSPQSLQDSWCIMAEQFGIVDCQAMDLFRFSSDRWWNERMQVQQYTNHASQRWTFQDWMLLCLRPDIAQQAPEYILEKTMSERLDMRRA